jgi:beta-ribofuranosylaminobenzene 5'-phosphate synthase
LDLSASRLPSLVRVHAPARLHLGLLNPAPGPGRGFGSIGLAISDLETRISVRRTPSAADTFEGPQGERARRYLEIMRGHLGLRANYHVQLEAAVPAHAGLGSGTQIALSIAAALRRLEGYSSDLQADARRLGRGARSGLGIALFLRGGLIVDGGRGPQTHVPPVISHLTFPPPWRIVLVLDDTRQGYHGPQETAAFAALAPFAAPRISENCRLVLMQALPALLERDLAAFGAAIAELQANLGDYFAPAQDGRFTSKRVAAALDVLHREGAVGIGQSSWGPTGFAFAPTAKSATRLIATLRRDIRFQSLDIRLCRGLNRGAHIEVTPSVDALRQGTLGPERHHGR